MNAGDLCGCWHRRDEHTRVEGLRTADDPSCSRCSCTYFDPTESRLELSPEVLAFAERMQKKFDQNRHKGTVVDAFRSCTPAYLFKRLDEECVELEVAAGGRLGRRAPEESDVQQRERIADEAADVANIALLIAGHFGGVKA